MSERPVDPVVEGVISYAAIPLLDKIQKELGRELITDVVVFREGVRGPRIRIGSDDVSNEADGELRLRIREAHGTNRFVYSLESVYKPLCQTWDFQVLLQRVRCVCPNRAFRR